MEEKLIEPKISDEEKIIDFLSNMELYNQGVYDVFTDNIDESDVFDNFIPSDE